MRRFTAYAFDPRDLSHVLVGLHVLLRLSFGLSFGLSFLLSSGSGVHLFQLSNLRGSLFFTMREFSTGHDYFAFFLGFFLLTSALIRVVLGVSALPTAPPFSLIV